MARNLDEFQTETEHSATDHTGITGVGGLPLNYMNGLEAVVDATISADTLYVEPGACRDRDNTADLVSASRVTINSLLAHSASTGLPQAQGFDEVGLDNLVSSPITCGTSGSSTLLTASASILSSTEGDGKFTPYLPTNIVAMSTVGTAFTGGKDITRDVAIDDFVGNSSKGWSRVASVDSETGLTLAAALPGGNATSEAWSIIHNVTVEPAAQGSRRPNTISTAGTAIVMPFALTVTPGSALTVGGLPRDESSAWVAVWVTGSGYYLSMQHIALLGVPISSVPARHVGWVPYNFDDSFYQIYYDNGWIDRRANWFSGSSISCTLYTASSTLTPCSWNLQPAVPRTAQKVSVGLELVNAHVSNDCYFFFRRSGFGVGTGSYAQQLRLRVGQSQEENVVTDIPVSGAGVFDSAAQLGTPSGVAIMRGWVENFGRPVPTPA